MALVTLLATACSNTATIHRNRGPAYEAKITRSEPGALYVLGDDGREYRVPADEVRDIDHPGNVLAVLGGVSLGFAGLALALPSRDENRFEDGAGGNARATVAFTYAALGLGLLVPGLAIWLRSRGAAANLQPATGDLPPDAWPAAARPLAR